MWFHVGEEEGFDVRKRGGYDFRDGIQLQREIECGFRERGISFQIRGSISRRGRFISGVAEGRGGRTVLTFAR